MVDSPVMEAVVLLLILLSVLENALQTVLLGVQHGVQVILVLPHLVGLLIADLVMVVIVDMDLDAIKYGNVKDNVLRME